MKTLARVLMNLKPSIKLLPTANILNSITVKSAQMLVTVAANTII